MKKQKAPVVLVTLLVLAIGTAAVLRNLGTGTPLEQAQTPPAPTDVTGKSRSAPSKDEIASKASRSPGAPRPDGEELAQKDEPSILLPDVQTYKPQPNTTSTSAQWYKEESGS
jgi:hypothetical protein